MTRQEWNECYISQGISPALIGEIERFRLSHPVAECMADRVQEPEIPFFGAEVFEMAASALLQGENILLTGTKATGKNVLSENLAWMFGRPIYDISFHVNTDSSALIGTDTFRNNEVVLRRGPVYDAAVYGAFAVLDEVNMAKNEAISVLHAALDFRRIVDVPGYERLRLDDATRFIGTMNYGYAGTKELNEALVSRFLVIDMPDASEETLEKILTRTFPDLKAGALEQIIGLFLDLQTKARNHEISSKPLDVRGLIGALKTVRGGLSPRRAIRMGVTNKTFDQFEREMVEDTVMTRIPSDWTAGDIF
ncbi:MAG: MoxR family ATPase [Lachnospiraceae bacterium]|nr:MoxR family ATPase [Lachnospiraceae bacterium]